MHSDVGFAAFFYAHQGNTQTQQLAQETFCQLTHHPPTFTWQTQSFGVCFRLGSGDLLTEGADANLLIHGEIYDTQINQPSVLAAKFKHAGLDVVQNLCGSFNILWVDQEQDQICLITDRLNSRRFFIRQHRNGTFITAYFRDQEWNQQALDPTGIAWLLANRYICRDRTLFQNIKVLQRACIHHYTTQGFHSQIYWHYRINPLSRSPQESTELLSHYLTQAVKRTLYDSPSDFYLALSAGYDSSTILGVASQDLNYPKIQCISYDHGRPIKGSDAYQSQQMSQALGYPHQVIESYHQNFIQHLFDNATQGLWRKLCWYCSVTDFWRTLVQQFNRLHSLPVLLAGDENMGFKFPFVEHPFDILVSLGMRGFNDFAWLQAILPDDLFGLFNHGLKRDWWDILEDTPYDDYLMMREFINFNQRLCNWLIPWRLSFLGNACHLRQPLLDNDLLDFTLTLTPEQKKERRLYKHLVTQDYPQIFQIPRASNLGDIYFDLTLEVGKYFPKLSTIIQQTTSPLDELIPPDIVLSLLKYVVETSPRQNSRRSPDAWPKKVQQKWEKWQGKQRPQLATESPANLLCRLLVLRIGLMADPTDIFAV